MAAAAFDHKAVMAAVSDEVKKMLAEGLARQNEEHELLRREDQKKLLSLQRQLDEKKGADAHAQSVKKSRKRKRSRKEGVKKALEDGASLRKCSQWIWKVFCNHNLDESVSKAARLNFRLDFPFSHHLNQTTWTALRALLEQQPAQILAEFPTVIWTTAMATRFETAKRARNKLKAPEAKRRKIEEDNRLRQRRADFAAAKWEAFKLHAQTKNLPEEEISYVKQFCVPTYMPDLDDKFVFDDAGVPTNVTKDRRTFVRRDLFWLSERGRKIQALLDSLPRVSRDPHNRVEPFRIEIGADASVRGPPKLTSECYLEWAIHDDHRDRAPASDEDPDVAIIENKENKVEGKEQQRGGKQLAGEERKEGGGAAAARSMGLGGSSGDKLQLQHRSESSSLLRTQTGMQHRNRQALLQLDGQN